MKKLSAITALQWVKNSKALSLGGEFHQNHQMRSLKWLWKGPGELERHSSFTTTMVQMNRCFLIHLLSFLPTDLSSLNMFLFCLILNNGAQNSNSVATYDFQ